jgi:hypothetical protein
MLTESEKAEILSLRNDSKALPEELKNKLLRSLQNGDTSIFPEGGDYLCCDLGMDAPNRYMWITFEDCRSLGGRAADNSMCGH